MTRARTLLLVVCLAVPPWPSIARAQPAVPEPAAPVRSAAADYFTDVLLIDQHGQPMRLYTDLIKGRTVIVMGFFTSCTSVCPVMGKTLVKIQDWLGDRLGRDAYILALTVDPATDTVDRLRAYAGQLGARPGWFFLGGTPANVGFALKKLGQRTETPEGHTNILIVGNETTGLWKKAFGLADSEALIAVVDSVLNDTGDTHR